MIIYVPSSLYLWNVNQMEADKSTKGNALVGRKQKKKELTKNIDNPPD
jgi:hypothetical protein